ncbi:MAG: DUF2064 domain-containing protein, partial [Alphaproteobacteria bacterium]|nr:DUF2064 domain-containing protein [Alphaproteobacteria bacterium]
RAVTPDAARRRADLRALARGVGAGLVAQGEGDLGARMARALAVQGRRGPALVVGTDVPELAPRHVAAALAGLRRARTVFGPAEDGGYWLVGVRGGAQGSLPPGALEHVRWSGPHALADSRASLPPGWPVLVLTERLADLDEGNDWTRFSARGGRIGVVG